ncbi:MAG TPA: hypothetical protein VGP99_00045 [Tepidisphaeraceae bacterium]|nr:hypothetical protein [Tepidisphaeraceae bacterium]
MTPAEQVFMMMQQLSADQQQAVLHLVQSLSSSPKVTPQINHSVVADVEQRLDTQRVQREMWGDDDI